MPEQPTPSPPAARSPRRARVVHIGSALLVVLAIAWYFRPRGPFPETQNGITFLGTHKTPSQNHGNSVTSATYTANVAIGSKTQGASPFHFTARSSTGDTWALSSNGATTALDDPLEFVRGRQSIFHVNLPADGVPGSYQWVDLIADDNAGHRGAWRLYDMPKLNHALLPTTPLHEAQTVQNIPVRARAWYDMALQNDYHDNEYHSGPVTVETKADVPPSALSRPSQVWGLHIKSLTPEWERPRAPNARPLPPDYHVGTDSRPFVGPGATYATAFSFETASPAAQHIVQIKAELTRYDAVMETVTFRNLPLAPFGIGRKVTVPKEGLSLTTPSGVIVTLQYAAGRPSASDAFGPNDLYIFYRLSSTAAFRPLRSLLKPNAPDPPFIVSHILAEKNGFTSAQNSFYPGSRFEFLEASNHVHLKNAKTPLSSVLPQITVTIAHQTELQTIPLTFTVPVRGGTPKEAWGKY